MNLPFIDVVVPTFNRASMLEGIISSLMAQSYSAERYLVTVVDDGSTDETWAGLQEIAKRYRNLKVFRISHGGRGAACDFGWRQGTGEIVAFTDDDCVADSGWLSAVARAFADHPGALGVYGKTITVPELVTPVTYQIVVRGPNTIYHGCNIAYRRSALLAVGGFDEEAQYAEDSQLAAAVLARGPIVFSPEMIIIHPPRPRVFLGRKEWSVRLEGALRFYCRYPDFYRRHRGPHFLIAVILRWVFGSTIKNASIHLPWLFRDPTLYLRFVARLLRERATLLAMLPSFWRTHKGCTTSLQSGNRTGHSNPNGD